MIVMAGFVCDGKHPFDVVVRVSLNHVHVVAGGYESAKGLKLVFLVATVIWWVGRRGQKAGGRLV